MITKTTGYQSSDGVVHATLDDAQKAEIWIVIGPQLEAVASQGVSENMIIEAVFKHRDELLDIFTTTSKSRPKARAINGAKKTRKPNTVVAQEAQAA